MSAFSIGSLWQYKLHSNSNWNSLDLIEIVNIVERDDMNIIRYKYVVDLAFKNEFYELSEKALIANIIRSVDVCKSCFNCFERHVSMSKYIICWQCQLNEK